MKRATRNGVIAVAAASGAMAVAGPAFADSAAHGASQGSPGVVSGNTIQLPVNVPVNVCGNTVDVVGLLNPAAGNSCANVGGGDGSGASSGSSSTGGAVADGGAEDSPGVVSGNTIQLPVHVPVNVSGNSVNVVGIGNPAEGNTSVNTSDEPEAPTPEPTAPPKAHPTPEAPRTVVPPQASLAHTGADLTVPAAASGAAMLIAGAALYRRFRPQQER